MRYISSVVLVGILFGFSAGCGGGGECTPRVGQLCQDDAVWWVDSCGARGEQVAVCDCGCLPSGGACLSPCPCVPDCGARVCGLDPVCRSQSCGTCLAGQGCSSEGVCVDNCISDCGGRACGLDPVCQLVSCGNCDTDQLCTEDGQCEDICLPDCGERQCGPDPCGVLDCGTCQEPTPLCNPQGFCLARFGTWRDPATGLIWEDPPRSGAATRDEAAAYCAALALADLAAGTFRLPDIDELKSLVVDCDALLGCSLTAACNTVACVNTGCKGCAADGGPGVDGCYWPAVLGRPCAAYWSSTPDGDAPGARGWLLVFPRAAVEVIDIASELRTRCVHDPV